MLQLLTPAGETVGFAKIGINALTSGLVTGERAALARLQASEADQAASRRACWPPVSWNGLEILVLSPLPVWLRRLPLTSDRLGPRWPSWPGYVGTSTASLGTQRLLAAADRPARPGRRRAPSSRRCARCSIASASLAGGSRDDLRLLARRPDPVEPGLHRGWAAGVGLGAVRRRRSGRLRRPALLAQAQVVRPAPDPVRAATECVGRAPELLDAFGVAPEAAKLTALAYLADLSVRYLADRQAEAGARLGAPGTWLLPAIEAGLGAGAGQP